MAGKSVLDVGCGRADLLDFLISRNEKPHHYVGIEAVPELADAADRKRHPDCIIVRADFIRDPLRLFVGADVVAFSGSLNTADPETFYATLSRAYEAATESLVFNFLCASGLAAASYLTWHRRDDVLHFARSLSPDVKLLDDYLDGDCTIAVHHPPE
jgi:hypothetical protein